MTTKTVAPRLLAIDTAGPRLQLALLSPEVTDVLVEDIAKGHAERMFGAIAELLQRNKISYADLTRLAVTTGPGSFTGLRIGLSAARGLALGLNVPLVGVPTLLAMSLGGPSGPHRVFVDARRDEAYIQDFSAPGKALGDPMLVSLDAARARLPESGTIFEPGFADIAALAQFAALADPSAFPPDPTYLRAADAKPQQKAKLARTGPSPKDEAMNGEVGS